MGEPERSASWQLEKNRSGTIVSHRYIAHSRKAQLDSLLLYKQLRESLRTGSDLSAVEESLVLEVDL